MLGHQQPVDAMAEDPCTVLYKFDGLPYKYLCDHSGKTPPVINDACDAGELIGTRIAVCRDPPIFNIEWS